MPALNQQLALFRYFLQQFGIKSFDELQRKYRDEEFDANIADNSLFYVTLSSKIEFAPDM